MRTKQIRIICQAAKNYQCRRMSWWEVEKDGVRNANSQRKSVWLLPKSLTGERVWACDWQTQWIIGCIWKRICTGDTNAGVSCLPKTGVGKRGSSYSGQYGTLLWRWQRLTWRSHNLIIPSTVVVSDSLFLFLQYRAPYMPPTQQYPVTSGTASFYPGTSPAEYSAYGKGFFCPRPTTTKHNHKHGGLSFNRDEISNKRSPNLTEIICWRIQI